MGKVKLSLSPSADNGGRRFRKAWSERGRDIRFQAWHGCPQLVAFGDIACVSSQTSSSRSTRGSIMS